MTDQDSQIAEIASARFTHVKFLNEEMREITGVATTPVTDRVGDIVEPLGVELRLPLPLLLDHKSDQAVGEVFEAYATVKGIRFKARIAKIPEPGAARDLVDYAWQLVKSGLRKTVSIGFRGLETEVMANGGLRFKSWELLEISLVSIPANPQALIESLKGVEADPAAPEEKRRRPTEPLPVVVFDAEKAKQSELTRLGGRVRQIDALLRDNDRQRNKHQYDVLRMKVLWESKGALEEEKVGLLRRSIAIETGTLDVGQEQQTKAAAAIAKPQQDATWPVRNLTRPEYPSGLRAVQPDADRFVEAKAALVDFWIDTAYRAAAHAGDKPMVPVAMIDFMALHGEVLACAEWNGLRAHELEQRVAELEANATTFKGVFQRALSYPRGSLVVHSGSLWCALTDVPQGTVPGASDLWQMAVKQGDLR